MLATSGGRRGYGGWPQPGRRVYVEAMTSPTHLDLDVAVLGWGKAGKTLAGALARAGRHVVMVEQSSQMYGGTCINIGCIPTKSLVTSAERTRPADDHVASFKEAVTRRDTLVTRLNAANFAMLHDLDTVTVVDGVARFTGRHTVEVTGGEDRLVITAPVIIINTGATPRRLDVPGADDPRVLDSTTLQHVDPRPARLVVVGGGPVGLEFASMFAKFGTRVTLLARGPRLLPTEDEDVAASVTAALADEGVELLVDAGATRFTDEGGDLVVHHDKGRVVTDMALVAVGRAPAIDGLGLEAAGIRASGGAVEVDDRLRTNVEGVYAVGDVNGGPQQTYVSYDDHRVVLDQLLGSGARSTTDRVAVPTTIFMTPPLARVGLSETAAAPSRHQVAVYAKPVAKIAVMPRPKILGETHGLIKVVVDAETDQVLGAALHSTDAQEVVNLLALAMRAGVTAAQLRDGIWTHPSSTEALNEVLASRVR